MSDAHAPDHERWADSVASYALGALPETETAGFEEHVAACAACRAELDELAPAVALLPVSVMPRSAPDTLRHRVMADVRREAELLRAAGPEADRPRAPRRRSWALRWSVAFAAATLVAGFAVGLLAGDDGSGGRTVQLAGAGAASDTDAHLELEDGNVTLAAADLPAPPRGRVYQVWLQPPGGEPEPTPALFVPRSDGTALVAVPDEAADMEALMVSAEPPGGSPAPTSEPILTGTMRD